MTSKKASWALYLSAIGIVSALFIFLATDLSYAQPIRERLGFLGQNQIAILNADNHAQRILFYLDRAAQIAALQTIDDLGASGGFAHTSPCGEYLGYAQWQGMVEELQAENGGTVSKPTLRQCINERFDETFTALFNQNMQAVVAQAPWVPQSSYDITLAQDGGKTRVIGNARQPIDLIITKDFTVPPLPASPKSFTVEPGTGRVSCTNSEDKRIMDSTYLDGLKLWIPAEATCGGVFPVLIMLHGNNPSHNTEFTIGTAMNPDGTRGRGLEQQVKQHIRNGGYPVIIAEPVHFKDGCGKGLWGEDFDVPLLLDKVRKHLQEENIQIASVSVAGHSGANCCPNTGMNRIARLAAAGQLDLKMYGVMDGTCTVTGYPENAISAFEGKDTAIFHITNDYRGGDTDYDAKLTASGAEEERCDASMYRSCKKASGKGWYSLISKGTTHWTIIDRALPEMLQRFFTAAPPGADRPLTPTEEAEGDASSGLGTWASGPCKGFVLGSIPYHGDDRISCAKSVCCMQPETLAQVERTKQLLEPGQSIIIGDAARKTENQRNAFLNYLAGGAVACGPQGLPTDKRELETIVPDGEGSERLQTALSWLNSPAGEPYRDVILDLRRYSSCRHVEGKAIDVRLKDANGRESVQALRNLMCRAGWANYGGEWWHYEYLTRGYEEAKRRNQCYFSELRGRDAMTNLPATVTPGFERA